MENIKLKNWNDPDIYPVWKDERKPCTLDNLDGIHVPVIDGSEILIYPKYKQCKLLANEKIVDLHVKEQHQPMYTEVDQKQATDELLALGSEAAEYVRQFDKDIALPIQLIVITRYKEKIDELSKILGGDLLIDIDKDLCWSCVRLGSQYTRHLYGNYGQHFDFNIIYHGLQVIPVSIYKKKM